MPAPWTKITSNPQSKIQAIFVDKMDDAKAAKKVYSLDGETNKELKAIAEESIEEVEELVVDETNEVLEEEKPSKIVQASKAAAIAAMAYFIKRAVTLGLLKIQANEKARQLEREQKTENETKIIDSVDKNIVFVTNNELAITNRDFAKEQQTKNGLTHYKWEHNPSENPRLKHVPRHGEIFSWDEPPADGHPGTQPNCLCTAIPIDAPLRTLDPFRGEKQMPNLLQHGEMPKLTNFSDFGGAPYVSMHREDNVITISYIGMVDFEAEYAARVLMNNKDADDIQLYITSPGGFVDDGMLLYHALKEHPAKVTVHIGVDASSIASVIAMAGDHITAHSYSSALIHEVRGCMCGREEDFEAQAQRARIENDIVAGIYADRTNKSVEQWREIMSKETTYSAGDLLSLGLIDEIIESGSDSLPDPIINAFENESEMMAFAMSANKADSRTSLLASYCKPKSINRGDNTMSGTNTDNNASTDLQAQIDDLKASVDKLTAEKAILETENEDLKANAKTDEEIQTLVAEQVAAEKSALENFNKVKAELTALNVEVKADNVDGLMRDFIQSRNVPNPEKFEGDALVNIYQYALEQMQNSADNNSVDGALTPPTSSKNPSDSKQTGKKEGAWGNFKSA